MDGERKEWLPGRAQLFLGLQYMLFDVVFFGLPMVLGSCLASGFQFFCLLRFLSGGRERGFALSYGRVDGRQRLVRY
jgi:hypothetical protein